MIFNNWPTAFDTAEVKAKYDPATTGSGRSLDAQLTREFYGRYAVLAADLAVGRWVDWAEDDPRRADARPFEWTKDWNRLGTAAAGQAVKVLRFSNHGSNGLMVTLAVISPDADAPFDVVLMHNVPLEKIRLPRVAHGAPRPFVRYDTDPSALEWSDRAARAALPSRPRISARHRRPA